MFDTINGLPVHALVVHAVVVLLPLMSLVTFAVAARRPWRVAALPVVVIDAGVVVAAFVAKESGEKFQARISSLTPGTLIAKEHGEQGSLVPLFALALFLAAVLVWFARRRPALSVPAVIVTGLAAVAAIGWTVVTGDSGAHAVWADLITSTKG